MLYFESLERKSFRLYTLFVILALQGHQYESKGILDIYTTLLSYVLPEKSDAFLETNCSLNTIAAMPNNNAKKSKLKSHPAIYFSAKPAYDITDIRVHVNISIERGGRYDTYLSTEVDLCEIRYSKVEIPFIRFYRNELVRVVKPNPYCPLKKNIQYEIKNFMLNNSFLPAIAIVLNWKADLKVWFNGRYSIALIGMGKVEWINI